MTTIFDPEKGAESRGNVVGTVPEVVRGIEVPPSAPTSGSAPPSSAREVQGLSDAPPITPRRRKPLSSKRGRWRRRAVWMVLFAAAGAASGWYYKPLSLYVHTFIGPKGGDLANVQTSLVKRGELRITMVEQGKLRAVKNSTIRIGVSGKITWLAEAGSKVKTGDKVAIIDAKQYEDQIRSWEADQDTVTKQKEIAEKQIPIAESNGKSAMAAAETAQGTAELALKQYTTIDVPKKLNDLETAINDAKSKLADQTKKRLDLQTQLDEMLNEGAEKDKLQSDLNLAKQTEASMKKTVTTAEDQRKLFRSNDYPQNLKTKKRAVEVAKLDMKKAQVNAENELLSKQADVQRLDNSLTRTKNNIDQYKNIVSRATATAPTDGLVFYGGPDLERYGISSDSIRVGADWYSNQPLMTIPDLSSFQVEVPVAEVYRGRVNAGMTATVLVDAVPGLVLTGKLLSVSSVSRNKVQYDSSSPQVYDATLALAEADPRMVSGMTVRVEIVTAVLPDAMFAPVEAIFNEEGKTAAFLWRQDGEDAGSGHIEKVPVLTGQSNDHFVELKQGVKEGDRLVLSRPSSFVTPRDYGERMDALFPATTSGPSTSGRGIGSGSQAADQGISGTQQGMPVAMSRGRVEFREPTTKTSVASRLAAAATAPATTQSAK